MNGTLDRVARSGWRGDEAVLADLVVSLDGAGDTPLGDWRRQVLARLGEVRELLVREPTTPADWLQARRTTTLRERNGLLDQLSAQRMQVLASSDLDRLVYELRRLVVGVRHHVQHVHDLAYDEVEYEVGGSE